MSIIKVCCNCVLLLYPIIQVFFLYFGTVTTKVWLRLSVLWDFFNFYTLLLIVLIANLVVLLIMIFEFATLVTPRIINFRLATASASLRLSESLEFIILCCVVKSLGWFLFFFLSQSYIFVICVHSTLAFWLFCTFFLRNFVHFAVVFYLVFIYNTSCRGELQ